MQRPILLLCFAALLAAGVASADTVILKNGDRLTGQTAEIEGRIGVLTGYGYILLKKDDIAKIEKQPVQEAGPQIDPALYDRLVDVALSPKRSSGLRSQAMEQLAALDAKKAIPVLVKLACEEKEDNGIISSAVSAIAAMDRENAPPLLFGILWNAKNPAAARCVVSALSSTGAGKEPLIRFCTEIVQRKDDLNAQINAAYALSHLGQLIGSAALASIADNEKVDLATRIKAVELMPSRGLSLQTNVLLKVALDAKQEKDLRLRAIRCLTTSPDDEAAVKALAEIALGTEDAEMQQIATETLRRSGDRTAVAVYAKLARLGLNPATRTTAIQSLSQIDDPVAVQGLRDVLLDAQDDMTLRLLAFDTLDDMQSPQVNEALMELATASDDDSRLKLRAVFLLRQRDKVLGDAALNVTIQNLLSQGNDKAVSSLRDTISNAKGFGAISVAVEILKSGKVKVDAQALLREMVVEIAKNYRSNADELTVNNAAEALALLGDKDSAKLFATTLLQAQDYPTKKVMCVALGALADPATIPALKVAALKSDENEDVKRCAAHSICCIAVAPAVEQIRVLTPRLHDKTARQQAEQFLERAETCWVPPNVYNVVYYLFNIIGYDELRLPVAKALDTIWNSPARPVLLELLQKTANDADQYMILLFFHYGRFRNPEIMKLYEQLAVSAAGPTTRYYAINALVGLNHEKTYELMEGYVADSEAAYPSGKRSFIDTLRSRKNKSSLPALVACLDDPTAGIVTRAAEVLAEMTGENFGPLPAPTPEANEETIQKWRRWLVQQGLKPRPRKEAEPPKDAPKVKAPPPPPKNPVPPKAPAKPKTDRKKGG
ncbi:MAG: HEAT repeat domain-containing protein [Planctomycetota bacterium]